MKRALFFLAVCCFLTGCGHSPAGKYVNDKNPKNTIELKSDGTFAYFNGGNGVTGKYTVDGNNVTLSLDPLAEKGTLDGNKLAIDNGTFTKQ